MAGFCRSPVRRAQKSENRAGSPGVQLKLALNIRGSYLPHKGFFALPGLSGRPFQPYHPQAIGNCGVKARGCAPVRGSRRRHGVLVRI